MITADKLAELIGYTAPALTNAINNAGYKGDFFEHAEFVGMTNGNQFCYKVSYKENGSRGTCKVFLTYNPGRPLHASSVTADY
jgi:hypothetical protein